MSQKQIEEFKQIEILYDKLLSSEFHIFPEKGKVNISNNHGVYIVFNPTNEVLHVGTTPSAKNGLNQRLYNHISNTGVFSKRYLQPNNINMRGTHKFKYLEVGNHRLRSLLEAYKAGRLCPLHFGTGEKNLKSKN
jgi:hypothetical protein